MASAENIEYITLDKFKELSEKLAYHEKHDEEEFITLSDNIKEWKKDFEKKLKEHNEEDKEQFSQIRTEIESLKVKPNNVDTDIFIAQVKKLIDTNDKLINTGSKLSKLDDDVLRIQNNNKISNDLIKKHDTSLVQLYNKIDELFSFKNTEIQQNKTDDSKIAILQRQIDDINDKISKLPTNKYNDEDFKKITKEMTGGSTLNTLENKLTKMYDYMSNKGINFADLENDLSKQGIFSMLTVTAPSKNEFTKYLKGIPYKS